MTQWISGLGISLDLMFPLAATAQDASAWNGMYGGLQASTSSGTDEYPAFNNEWDLEGSGAGLFVGYMASAGSWSYGGEIAYSASDFNQLPNPEYKYDYALDLKGRVGYATNRALVYGVLGYGISKYQDGDTSPGNVFDASGMLFGVGVDYLVSDNFFVGGEMLRRSLKTNYPGEGKVTTFNLRAGFKF